MSGEKKCIICKNCFEQKSNQTCCSDPCRKIQRNKKAAKRARRFRIRNFLKETVGKSCEICGVSMVVFKYDGHFLCPNHKAMIVYKFSTFDELLKNPLIKIAREKILHLENHVKELEQELKNYKDAQV